MTLKTPQEMAKEWANDKEKRAFVAAVIRQTRDEFARKAAEVINKKAVSYHRSNSIFDGQIAVGLNDTARIVESLASTNSSEIPNSSTAPECKHEQFTHIFAGEDVCDDCGRCVNDAKCGVCHPRCGETL